MSSASTDEPPRPSWLRILALLGLVLLPVAWLAPLGSQTGDQFTNVVRVAGALIAAGMLWRLRYEGEGLPWGSLLMGGIAGSLGITALSVPFPVLGRYGAAGWLMSGAVGGVMFGLGILAWSGGGSRHPSPPGDG